MARSFTRVLIKNDGDVLSKSLDPMSCSLRNSEKSNTYCNLGFESSIYSSPATLGRPLQNLGFPIEKVEFDSLGLSVSEILRYFLNPTFATIYPWRPWRWQTILFRTLLKISALPFIRQIDEDWLQKFANSKQIGSTFKLVTKKR